MKIRVATVDDLDEITAMMHEHADFEGAGALCHFNQEAAGVAMFGVTPTLHGLIANLSDESALVAGVALWYPTFSSWSGCSGIWLEDIYVRPAYRGNGLGRQFLHELRALTTGRVEWDVQDTNDDAQAFYRRLGAMPVPGWSRYRWTI